MIEIKHIRKDISLYDSIQILCNGNWEACTSDMLPAREGFFVFEDDVPKAICTYLEKSFFYEECMGVALIEVARPYRQQGITKHIAQEVFSIAHTLNKGVRMTEYSPMGIKALKRRFRAFAKAFHKDTGLPFIEDFETVYSKQ